MTVYQICFWSDTEDMWVPVFGLPLYANEEEADGVVSILKIHPKNGTMNFVVSSRTIKS